MKNLIILEIIYTLIPFGDQISVIHVAVLLMGPTIVLRYFLINRTKKYLEREILQQKSYKNS